MSDKKEIIEIKHLGKTFGKNEVLKDINFSIKECAYFLISFFKSHFIIPFAVHLFFW